MEHRTSNPMPENNWSRDVLLEEWITGMTKPAELYLGRMLGAIAAKKKKKKKLC